MKDRPSPARQKWQRIIDRQQASGLSVARFCQRHDLATPSFYAWRRRLSQGGADGFVEVRLARADGRAGEAVTLTDGTIEIGLRPDRQVRVRPGFDTATLRQVLGVLEGLA